MKMRMRSRLSLALVISAIGLLLLSGAAFAGYSYTDDFGTGDPIILYDLGWPSLAGDMTADGQWSTYPGWGGRSANPATLTGSLDNYYYFEKALPGYSVPTTGLWVFSANVYNSADGPGARSYSAGSCVGLGRFGAQMFAMLALSPVGYDANTWMFDARTFTNGTTDYRRFGGSGFIGACVAKIYIDYDNKKTWATITDTSGASASSGVISFTNYASFDALNILQDKRDSQYGMPVDNISFRQERPISISYQGKLFDNGEPMNGTASIKFDIFDAETGGSAVWSGTAGDAIVADGVFSKSIEPVAASLFQEKSDLWLQVTVNGQTMNPRTKLETAPYAARSFTTAP